MLCDALTYVQSSDGTPSTKVSSSAQALVSRRELLVWTVHAAADALVIALLQFYLISNQTSVHKAIRGS